MLVIVAVAAVNCSQIVGLFLCLYITIFVSLRK
nr:MAG TPA: hypothetical protein [Caudoviricetes sp.]